jgi:heme-degrading monooxygenase HmoA
VEVIAMYARVSTFLGSPAAIDDAVANARDNVAPAMQKMDGFQGLMVLVDRASGRSIAVTLWDSEEKLRESERDASRVRRDSATATHETILSVERFEIALDTR